MIYELGKFEKCSSSPPEILLERREVGDVFSAP